MAQKYYYCIIRTDISLADQICQVSHASAEAGSKFGIEKNTFMVLLQVPNEFALQYLAKQLEPTPVEFVLVHEPDDAIGDTAICTGPIEGELRKIFKQYQTWKQPQLEIAC